MFYSIQYVAFSFCLWVLLQYRSFPVWYIPTWLFCFCCLCFLVSCPKISLPVWILGNYCLCFLIGVLLFQVLHSVFNPFWVNVVYGLKEWFTFFFCLEQSSFPNSIYWRVYSLLFAPFSEISWLDVLIWGSLFCSTDLCVCFYANTILFWLL